MPADTASHALPVIANLRRTIDEMVRELHGQNDWLNPRVQSLARLYLAYLRQYQIWVNIALSEEASHTPSFPQSPEKGPVSPAAPSPTPDSTSDTDPRVTPKLARISPPLPSSAPSTPCPAPGLLYPAPQHSPQSGAHPAKSPLPLRGIG